MQAFGRNQLPAKGGIRVSVFRCQVSGGLVFTTELKWRFKIWVIKWFSMGVARLGAV